MEYLMIIFALLWIILEVDSEYSKCFAHVTCMKGDTLSEQESVQVYPYPDCCGDFSNGATSLHQDLNATLQARVQLFREELNGTASPPQSTDEKKCFAPVTCGEMGYSWVQVYPPIACYMDHAIDFNPDDLLSQNINDAIQVLQNAVNNECGACALSKTDVTNEISRLGDTKIQNATEGQKTCYAPVSCLGKTEEAKIEQTWMEVTGLPEKAGMSSMKMDDATGKKAVDALNDALEKSVQMFKDFTTVGSCGGC